MNKIALIFNCFLFALYSYGQTCGNPSARLDRLSASHLTKDSIYQWVKTDLDFIQPKQQDTIADIGSYDGYYPLIYSIFSDSTVYYLNDISTKGFVYFDNIKAICTKIKGRDITNKFTIVIGQDDSTNLKDHQFNKVLIRDALHHFKSMDKMLEDIKRIMKPKARLILFEPIRGRNSNTESLCKGAMTVEELLSLLNKNGFILTRELSQNIGGSWFEFKLLND
ncbi:methyltransferase domain-containing protein [Flavobacterium sp. SUN046]|uniref:class I SAM-dependent methyltransferase n=1 Tax=Flavobacterium sp. SUN046 TaxID=3002440 RepID=UPI002DB8322D|nr:methyltransferase domain-containing protein [Flavobacterium sp. SUN046]MEC4049825.1 methyltransferase domain-containing protein [Flavobacterium sp. SUN046]